MTALQRRINLTIATSWAGRLNLELCPKHTLEKITQDEESISRLRNEIEGLRYEIRGVRLNEERLEDKLKGAAIREKLLIEEKDKIRQIWSENQAFLVRDLTRLRRVIKRQDGVSYSLGFLGILPFFIGVWVGGQM